MNNNISSMNQTECICHLLHFLGVDPAEVYRVEIESTAYVYENTKIKVYKYSTNVEGNKYVGEDGESVAKELPELYIVSNRVRGKHERSPIFVDVTAYGDDYKTFIEGF